MSRTVFRNANVLDGISALGKADVIVEGDRIVEIASLPNSSPPRDGDIVYDLKGKTLMPGMVAGHGHLSLHGLSLARFMEVDMQYPAPYMGVLAAKNAHKTLEAGFTTYVGAGGSQSSRSDFADWRLKTSRNSASSWKIAAYRGRLQMARLDAGLSQPDNLREATSRLKRLIPRVRKSWGAHHSERNVLQGFTKICRAVCSFTRNLLGARVLWWGAL